MAIVKILIEGDEMEEKKELSKLIKDLKKREKEKLKGFLEGLRFAKDCK